MKMFRHFPLPMMSKLRKQSANSKGWILLLILGSTLGPFSTAYAFFLRGFFQDFRSAHLGFLGYLGWCCILAFCCIEEIRDFCDFDNWQLGNFFFHYLENSSSTLQILLP